MKSVIYSEAIKDALDQSLELSPDVVILGQLVEQKLGVFGTTVGLVDKYGRERVQDFPVSESLMTSVAMGLALSGKRPVVVHHRLDFTIYAMDAITNWLSLWRFKSNNQVSLPVTIRTIIGKGWGQGPQHSKCLHAWFGHLPGIRVAMPATPHDAKGLLMESVFGEDPTIILENRSLFSMKEDIPETPYRIPFGRAAIRQRGTDVTVVALGYLVPMALRAAEEAKKLGISVEVIDLRTISPLDKGAVIESVGRTGRLVVADPGWHSFGVSGEIMALVCERLARELKSNPVRVTLPDSHTPMSAPLEAAYYPTHETILDAIKKTTL